MKKQTIEEQVSRIKGMIKTINEDTNENFGMLARMAAPMAASYIGSKMADANEEDINELGGYIGNKAPEKITGPEIPKIDPKIYEGYEPYDILRAHRLLLNIYSYGDINVPTEEYVKISRYMEELYKSAKFDEEYNKSNEEPNKEDIPF